MSLDYVITKRLSLIKYFYELAVNQSHHTTPQNSISVLMFHDCVELFLNLAAEKVDATVSDRMFILDYFNVINQELEDSELSQKTSIKRLNDARIAFKHHGILLEESDIEFFRVTVKLFFEENTLLIFDISFDDINLIDLIENSNVRSILSKSQELQSNEDYKGSIEHIALAYYVLIKEYELSKEVLGESLFSVLGWEFRFITSGSLNETEKKIVNSIKNINKSLKPLFFGIDYRKYVKFRALTPDIIEYNGSYPGGGIDVTDNYYNKFRIIWFRDRGDQVFKKENLEYCLDFVIEASLKLQEFDFTLKS